MARKQVHVVYGFTANNPEPRQEPDVQGFGRSDDAALADARSKATAPLFYFFIRSNGNRVPVSSFGDELAGKLAMRPSGAVTQ